MDQDDPPAGSIAARMLRIGYWMNETTGELKPAIWAYMLETGPLSPAHIEAIRAYLRQWITGGWGPEPEVARLRQSVEMLVSRETITDWLDDAAALGIDPL